MKRIKIKKLILHVGSHKTGSTYIQKSFKENHSFCPEKTLLYPEAGCGLLFGHHEIFNGLKRNSGELDKLFESMGKEVRESHRTILLSSENFEYLNEAEVAQLVGYFAAEQVQVIYLYRAWTPLSYAMWQEEIKHGSTLSYEAYCLRHVGFPMSSNLLNYSKALDAYEKVVGKESIAVASYDALVSKDLDLMDFICSQIGLNKVPEAGKGARINSSFDPFLVEIIRVMNEFAMKENYRGSYMPKHLYINKACSGKVGMARDQRIREAMANYLTRSYDFTQSFAFKYVYKHFFDKYSACFVDGISNIDTIMNEKYVPPPIVNTGYLLNNNTVKELYFAWQVVREEMRRGGAQKVQTLPA